MLQSSEIVFLSIFPFMNLISRVASLRIDSIKLPHLSIDAHFLFLFFSCSISFSILISAISNSFYSFLCPPFHPPHSNLFYSSNFLLSSQFSICEMKIVYDNQPFLPFDLLSQITCHISREQEDKLGAHRKH